MSTRGMQALSQRGGSLVNGSLSKKHPLTPSKAGATTPIASGPRTPTRSISCTRPLKNTPVRPSRVNTAVNSSPRKVSAPCKLISAIGGSLDSLPDNITIRRKVSTPVRSSNLSSSNNNNNNNNNNNCKPGKQPVKRASSTVVPANSKKKFSAPAKLITEQSVPNRISKDHTNSTSSQNPSSSGTKGPTPGSSSSAGESGKSSKKGPYAIPEVQPLPTLKEEKKSKSKHKKMSSTATSSDIVEEPLPSEPSVANKPSTNDFPEPNLKKTFPLGLDPPSSGGTHGATDDVVMNPGTPEKSNLEKMVSDLIRSSEGKKQEIAALKMEINRLKEAARERLHQTACSEAPKDAPSQPSTDRGTNPALPKHNVPSSAPPTDSSRPDEGEISQLESVIDSLSTENRLLRDHLQQLGVSLDSSPLSDQQKEMILSRVSSAFSQAGGCNENLSSAGGEKDWDNKSSSSISEISVACLQGRIQQMEETHYSTNEELQATLQELDDLREQLSECQIEVQQLQEEKQVILESLTQQTEKLNEARGYNDTLKLMLIQQSENSQDVLLCERTQRLMELLKSVQEDKELAQLKQDEFEQQMQASKEAEEHFHREAQLIRDRMKLLESMVESATSDKKKIESQLFEAQEIVKVSEKETTRLKSSLATAKEKITDLEAAVISGEKSELADVLERVCSEKESSEREVTNLQRKVNNLVCENDRLKEQVAALQESLMVTRNNAKTNLDDVEWRRTRLDERRRELEMEIETLKATVTDAQMTCQHHLEDKRELKANLSEAQKKLSEMMERQAEKEKGFADERSSFAKQVEEWDQFQKDLLTSVRVANDFKTEAQRSLEKIEHENTMLKERLRQLDVDLEKARASKLPSSANSSVTSLAGSSSLGVSGSERRMFKGYTNGESILSDRRNNPRPLARGDSRVKSLIESIECATKQTKAGSRSSSTSSLASTGSENNNNVKSQLRRAETEGMIRNLSPSLSSIPPLKDSSLPNSSSSPSPSPLRALNSNSLTDSISSVYSNKTNPNSTNLPDTVKMSQLSSEKNSNSKFGSSFSSSSNMGESGSKSVSILNTKIEPLRRNSYNQMNVMDKKDPLATLSQGGGSKRNALLKWCQSQTLGYKGVDITNFSSSWNDGLAFCAILDTYMPEKINYSSLNLSDKKRNFEIAFAAAESVGIPTNLDINDMITLERPTWQSVFNYVTCIYSHFET